MSFDTFLKIDGIPGESTDDAHKEWIEVQSFSHNIHQPASASVSTAGGAPQERCEHSDFSITKMLDKASPKIYEFCCSGKPVKEVIIEMCRAGGDKLKYMEIKMEEVIISNVSPTGSNGADFPSESVNFNYGKIKWVYTQQKRLDGTGGGNVPGGWDLVANKVYA
jgi:type VI secretion system secreted protein Hcp